MRRRLVRCLLALPSLARVMAARYCSGSSAPRMPNTRTTEQRTCHVREVRHIRQIVCGPY
eukprot:4716840-Prymnesium_polylepis.1